MKGCDYMNLALKRTLLYIAVFASALMIITVVITAVLQGSSAETPAMLTEVQSSNSYWLRAFNGHIAVYSSEEDASPMIETAIDIEGLRAVDRTLLENGIGAATYEDALKLLEDFGS